MFDFLKKKKHGRLAGTQVKEEFNIRPIPYRTCYGGSRPTDYVETEEMTRLYKAAIQDVEHVIAQGLIDEYTDPKMFDIIIDAYYKLVENEVERQYITFSEVIQSIRNVAKEELCRGKRTEEILNEIINATNETEKGIGDMYVDIKE